jgi:hypothetical protein
LHYLDDEQFARQRSVHRIEEENAMWLQGPSDLADDRIQVGHMLEPITAVG